MEYRAIHVGSVAGRCKDSRDKCRVCILSDLVSRSQLAKYSPDQVKSSTPAVRHVLGAYHSWWQDIPTVVFQVLYSNKWFGSLFDQSVQSKGECPCILDPYCLVAHLAAATPHVVRMSNRKISGASVNTVSD